MSWSKSPKIYVDNKPYYILDADILGQYEPAGYFYLVFKGTGETKKVKVYNIRKVEIGDYDLFLCHRKQVVPHNCKEHCSLKVDKNYKYEFDIQDV